MLKKINLIILVLLVLTLGVSYFKKDAYKNVNSFDPTVFTSPIQQEAVDSAHITFQKDGYEYDLTPVDDYELNALITHKMDYRMFSLNTGDNVFPIDLCVIWGDNVRKKAFQDKTLSFSQDMRFCSYQYSGDLVFNSNEFSNNHLIFQSKGIEDKANALAVGDQVRIRGKLVDVSAKNIGKKDAASPDFTMTTSVRRDDTGAGACEVIYVEQITVLKKADTLYNTLYAYSIYGLIGFFSLNVLFFIVRMFVDGMRH